MAYYILGHIGTRPKLLGTSKGGDEAQAKRHEAEQDGYGDVMLVTRGVIDMLHNRRELIPNY